MRVGVDLDGCVYHWERTARYLLRRRRRELGLPPDPALDVVSPYFDYVKDVVDRDAWRWLWKEGITEGLFRYGHVYTGAPEAVRTIARAHDVVIITARPASAAVDTMDWIQFQRWPVVDLRLLTHGEPKSSVPCDVYIDDSAEVCEELCENADAFVIKMDRPWNKGARCHASTDDWSVVLDHVFAYAENEGLD